jgi:crotonobetainyl-CoA:carnitine CoA-transferase CaiB-like acyl-CoA transferase
MTTRHPEASPSHGSAAPPLAGVTVVGVSQFLSGPFCTMMLADFGAKVIKIESPAALDPMRLLGTARCPATATADGTGATNFGLPPPEGNHHDRCSVVGSA